jgi:hypothetical protein
MPLEKGPSPKSISDNIKELLLTYQNSGKIGNTTPRNRQHAHEIAVAIAESQAKKSK